MQRSHRPVREQLGATATAETIIPALVEPPSVVIEEFREKYKSGNHSWPKDYQN